MTEHPDSPIRAHADEHFPEFGDDSLEADELEADLLQDPLATSSDSQGIFTRWWFLLLLLAVIVALVWFITPLFTR